jgi:hypothetical protein
MSIHVTKWCFIAAVLLTSLCWTPTANHPLEGNLLICFAAAVVLLERLRTMQHRWELTASDDDWASAIRTYCGE